jgi:hypothetical protein
MIIFWDERVKKEAKKYTKKKRKRKRYIYISSTRRVEKKKKKTKKTIAPFLFSLFFVECVNDMMSIAHSHTHGIVTYIQRNKI